VVSRVSHCHGNWNCEWSAWVLVLRFLWLEFIV
jgi:hypothetical protein